MKFRQTLARYPSGSQTQPRFWDDGLFNNPDQPVVGICWHEVQAYCAWLGAQTGQHYRLPSEAEWEAAVHGSELRGYVWGDPFESSHCNTFECHIRRTTPIGLFSDGKTPEGLTNLTGNVWEWTQTLYQPYPCNAANRDETGSSINGRHVVRGGSWTTSRIPRASPQSAKLGLGVPRGKDFARVVPQPQHARQSEQRSGFSVVSFGPHHLNHWLLTNVRRVVLFSRSFQNNICPTTLKSRTGPPPLRANKVTLQPRTRCWGYSGFLIEFLHWLNPLLFPRC